MTSISPTLPTNISPLDLPSHYQSVRERLMNGRERPRLTVVPKEEPVPEAALPVERASNRLGVFSVQEGNRLGVTAIEEIVPHGRYLNKQYAIDTLQEICDAAGVPLSDALGSKRQQEIVHARWACWSLLLDRGHSKAEISRVFGYDRATVGYGVRKYRGRGVA